MTKTREELIKELTSSHKQVSVLLESVAHDQDWRPGPDEWPFRYLGAHLAAAEKECFLERVRRVMAEENPRFEYYHNNDRDFSQQHLRDSLQVWALARRGLLNFVRDLPPEKLSRYGTHVNYGRLTILDLLQLMLDHDLGHLNELRQAVVTRLGQYCRQEVADIYRLFQDWFNGDVPNTGDILARFAQPLAENFTIIGANGEVVERAAFLSWLGSVHGARSGFKAWTDDFQLRQHTGEVAIATYQEWQQFADGATTTRVSSLVFREKAGTPNNVEWLHMHESWLKK